jgi:hypothetical protein
MCGSHEDSVRELHLLLLDAGMRAGAARMAHTNYRKMCRNYAARKHHLVLADYRLQLTHKTRHLEAIFWFVRLVTRVGSGGIIIISSEDTAMLRAADALRDTGHRVSTFLRTVPVRVHVGGNGNAPRITTGRRHATITQTNDLTWYTPADAFGESGAALIMGRR